MALRARSWRLITIAAAMLLICCASCDWPGYTFTNGHGMVLAPYETISVYQLASRLAMSVDRSNSERAVLGDSINTVMITAEPVARIYVNGRVIGHDCEILPVRGMLFVSSSAQSAIGRRLRPPLAQAPPRRAVVRPVGQSASVATQPMLGPVMIDAGHGGRDAGATGINGVEEKTVNLAVALQVARALRRRNVQAILTRSDDTFCELDERCRMSNSRRAALFVSIHADSAPNAPQARGYTVYIARSPSAGSVRLATAVSNELASAGIVSRGVRNANFRVLVGTTAPSVLVELGFLSNRTDAAALVRADYQRRLTDAIVAGIMTRLRGSTPRAAQVAGKTLDRADRAQ